MARLNFEDITQTGVAQGSLAKAGLVEIVTSADELFERGLKYAAGRDVEPDMVKAHKWFNLAALRGCDRAKTYRMEMAQEMSKREIARAQREAREWLRQH